MITKLHESQQAGRKIRETATVFAQCGSSKADVVEKCVVQNSDNYGDKSGGYGKENCVWELEENFGNKQACDREIASLSTSELLKKLLQSKQQNKTTTEEPAVNCKEKVTKKKRSTYNKKANSDLVSVSVHNNNGRMDNSSKQIRQSPPYNENTSSNSFEEEDLPVIPQEVLYNQTIDFLLAEAERTLSLESPTNSVHSLQNAASPEVQLDFTEPQPFTFAASAGLPTLCTQLSSATTSSRHSSENVSVERQESVDSFSEEEKEKEDNLTDDAVETDKEVEDAVVLVPSSKLISFRT